MTDHEIDRAVAALRDGRLVVMPTETVYGLAANALDEAAVRRIFAAKGRPADNPLIVHVADEPAARALAAAWPPAAARLAAAFWPGPLTLVVPAGELPSATTAGLDSVALRVPAHPVAQALLRAAGMPLAAPSANRSGSPSPTRVADARADLGDAVAVYLDGGPCDVGVESTVVDVRGVPTLLRPGGIPRDAIEAVVGPLAEGGHGPVRAPGMKYRHYAPRARLVLATGRLEEARRALTGRVAVVASRQDAPAGPDVFVPGDRDDATGWARSLFALLRDLDAQGYDAIVVSGPTARGLGEAVWDRLHRAAAVAKDK